MTYPPNESLEAIWDGSLGDTVTIKAATDASADAYGEKNRSYATGTATNGRMKILKANEVNKDFGYMRPGDAIALLKLTATIGQNDLIVFNSITYEVIGMVAKKTHTEVACRRVD